MDLWQNRLSGILGVTVVILSTCIQSVAQTEKVDSLLNLLSGQKGLERIQTLTSISAAEVLSIDSAIRYAQESFNLAQESKDTRSIIISEYQLGMLYTKGKQDSLALKHLSHALDFAKTFNDPMLIYAGYAKLASYYTAVNQTRKSIEFSNEALKIAERNNYRKETADSYSELGQGYRKLDSHKMATENYFKALRIYESLDDLKGTAETYNNIGSVYLRTGDYDDALEFFNRALKINTQHDYLKLAVVNMSNIAVVHQKRGNYDSAIRRFKQVLPLTRQVNETEREAIVTGNIGSTLVEQGKFKEGLSYLERALVIKEKINNVASTLHTLNDITDVKLKLGDAYGARETAMKVVEMGKQYEVPDQLRYGFLFLSESYRQLKDFENAFSSLEQYNDLTDSLFQLQKTEQINELQIQYETEKKDMAISTLQQEQQIANAQKKIYFLGGTMVVLVLAGLYFGQRAKTRRNQQLLEKEREIDRMKSDFFANISHEFRTPLSLILGPIENMLSKVRDDQERFQLALMKKSASRLLRLINQILELSKLRAGYLELKATELEGVSLIKGVAATFQSLADEKGNTLEFKSDSDKIPLYCDQEKFETIFINLLSNAFKFSDVGGRITVKVSRTEAGRFPNGAFELQVTDTGAGIPKEHLDHIFDRFYTAGSSSEKQFGGTGIGLALTRELVELHGGTIGVISEVGAGTTVTVTLPLGKDHLRADKVIANKPVDVQTTQHRDEIHLLIAEPDESLATREAGDKPLIVLIEDNLDVRNYMKSILRDTYTVKEAPNGEAGLELATSVIPDLIISDVMMPKMDGYETCRHLKKDEKTSHIPVILLTAKSSLHSRIHGLETEADLYLSKPFVPQELLLCIHNLIESRRKLRERYNRQVVLKPTEIAINSTDEQFLQRLMKVIELNYADENFTVEQFSMEMGMSRSQLHRKLQALTNESASQFIRTYRLQRAMEMLKKNHGSVSEVAYKVGFSSHPYFNKCFSEQFGCTPSSLRDGAGRSTTA